MDAGLGQLFADAGLIVPSAFISPLASDRLLVRNLFPGAGYPEYYRDPFSV